MLTSLTGPGAELPTAPRWRGRAAANWRRKPSGADSCYQRVVIARGGADACFRSVRTYLGSSGGQRRRGNGLSAGGACDRRNCRLRWPTSRAATCRGGRSPRIERYRSPATQRIAASGRYTCSWSPGHLRNARAAPCPRTARRDRLGDAGDGAALGARGGDCGCRPGADSALGHGAVPGAGGIGERSSHRPSLRQRTTLPVWRLPLPRRLTFPDTGTARTRVGTMPSVVLTTPVSGLIEARSGDESGFGDQYQRLRFRTF